MICLSLFDSIPCACVVYGQVSAGEGAVVTDFPSPEDIVVHK